MMTPELRKVLEVKRQQLEIEQTAATARANQARGGIGMIDALLALPDGAAVDPPNLNGDAAAGADATH